MGMASGGNGCGVGDGSGDGSNKRGMLGSSQKLWALEIDADYKVTSVVECQGSWGNRWKWTVFDDDDEEDLEQRLAHNLLD